MAVGFEPVAATRSDLGGSGARDSSPSYPHHGFRKPGTGRKAQHDVIDQFLSQNSPDRDF